jgi:hypothetical protein
VRKGTPVCAEEDSVNTLVPRKLVAIFPGGASGFAKGYGLRPKLTPPGGGRYGDSVVLFFAYAMHCAAAALLALWKFVD